MTRALAIIDGEHYPEVVRQALAELPYEFVAALLVGGKEKLRGGESYGVPLAASLEEAVAEYLPEVVVDLSDEPVLGPAERFRLASRVLALGLPYVGADFRFDPPVFAPVAVPSIAVAGTGKRVGKTAVTGKLARLAARSRDVVVVSMGRGGPAEPEVVESPPSVDELVARSRAGAHAASDFLETAVVAGVVTVGCRRCGGGLAGETWVSNALEGLAVAAARGPELLDLRRQRGRAAAGGGRCPAARRFGSARTGRRRGIPERLQDPRLRPGSSDHGRSGHGGAAAAHRGREARARRRLRAAAAPARASRRSADGGLRRRPGGDRPPRRRDRPRSASLADRDALRAELERVDADVYLVEIKAAGIDVVAETARARGSEVVFADNDVVSLPGEPDLEAELAALVEAATKEPAVA